MPPTKDDLLKLKWSGLLEQANEAGVSQPEIDAFENGNLTKAEFVEIVLKAISAKRELTLTLEAEHEVRHCCRVGSARRDVRRAGRFRGRAAGAAVR
jgi:hypothetical protein